MSQQFEVTPPPFQPGDHLLYGRSDLFGWVTSIKTWSPAVHIEEYVANNTSVASRNGIGVGAYPVRTAQLIAILRPRALLNLDEALQWFSVPYDQETNTGVKGRPYGWVDLLRFYQIHLKTNGWICSQTIALFDNAAGFYPFHPDYDTGSIDPGDFFVTNCFDWVWIKPGIKI